MGSWCGPCYWQPFPWWPLKTVASRVEEQCAPWASAAGTRRMSVYVCVLHVAVGAHVGVRVQLGPPGWWWGSCLGVAL